MRGEEPGLIPVIEKETLGQSALPGIEAYEFFEGARQKRAGSWENKVTIRTYSPFSPPAPRPQDIFPRSLVSQFPLL